MGPLGGGDHIYIFFSTYYIYVYIDSSRNIRLYILAMDHTRVYMSAVGSRVKKRRCSHSPRLELPDATSGLIGQLRPKDPKTESMSPHSPSPSWVSD